MGSPSATRLRFWRSRSEVVALREQACDGTDVPLSAGMILGRSGGSEALSGSDALSDGVPSSLTLSRCGVVVTLTGTMVDRAVVEVEGGVEDAICSGELVPSHALGTGVGGGEIAGGGVRTEEFSETGGVANGVVESESGTGAEEVDSGVAGTE